MSRNKIVVIIIAIAFIFYLVADSSQNIEEVAGQLPKDMVEAVKKTRDMDKDTRDKVLRQYGSDMLNNIDEKDGAKPNRAEVRKKIESLKPDERSALVSGIMKVVREKMKKRMEEYFSASEDERKGVLDEHIDSLKSRFKSSSRAGPPKTRGLGKDEDARLQRFRTILDNTSAEERAQFQVYREALQDRAQERGIKLPFGGPGK